MGTFLPSEIARLVLGYLEDQQCMVAYNEFLNRCSHLAECRGREFFTTIMGLSLNDILDDYCAIHSYVRNMKCDEDFKKKVGQCQRLLEKVKLILGDKQSVNNDHGKQTSRSVENNGNCHRKVHQRNNSCDSVITIKTEKSYVCRQRTTSNDRNERCTNFSKFGHPSGDVDIDGECSAAEATNLEDLPGYGDDASYWNDVRMMKTHRRMHLLKKNNLPTSLTPNPKIPDSELLIGAHLQNENLNKSLDRALNLNKLAHHQTLEFDFRKALGLIKQPDVQHNISVKTPPKRKNVKTKMCSLARKTPHTADLFPNESLNVMTITNAMLDCTELHEIIADNINKIYNLSTAKPSDSVMETSRTIEATNEMPAPKTAEESANMQVVTIDDYIPDYENVIKSIVEKTEKEPLFDQLLNDVLAASVESTSGTESDGMSRPDTSTPEKMNESSPASSCRSPDINSAKKLQTDKRSRERPHSMENVDSGLPDVDLQSTLISPILPPTPITKILHSNVSEKDTKKYYRYPRGGKKMDLLKENYKNVIGGDKLLSVPPTTRVSQSAAKVAPDTSDPKVIILSNERVHTNLLSDQGPIVIQKAHDHISEPDFNDKFNVSTETVQSNNGFNKMCESVKASTVDAPRQMLPDKQFNNVLLPSTSKCQVDKIDTINSSIKCYPSNLQYQPISPLNQDSICEKAGMISMPEHSSIQQNFTNFYTSYHPLVDVQGHQNTYSVDSRIISESWQKNPLPAYGLTVIGKPPELIISNGKVTTGFGSQVTKKTDTIYSKSEIMDMPTVIEIHQPTPYSTGYIEIPNEIQFPPNYSQKSTGSKTIKKLEKRTQNVKIYPKIYPKIILNAVKMTKNVDHSAKRDLNTDISSVRSNDSSEGGRFVIDEDLKRNSIESQLDSANCQEIPNPITTASSDVVESAKDKSNDFEFLDPKRKTPDVVITKKLSFSTPRRNFSHVRKLNFNTPITTNHVAPRRALTSPKLSTQMSFDMNKTLQTPSTSNKNSFRSKMKNVKSCLFQHSEEAEEPCEDDKSIQSDAVSVDSVKPELSMAWDQIQGVSQIIKPRQPVQLQKKFECTQFVEKLSEITDISRTKIKRPGIAWDQHLRKMLCLDDSIDSKESEKKNAVRKSCKTNIARNKKSKIKLTASLKKEAKLLEDALLNKSFEASPGPSKTSAINDGKGSKIKEDSAIENMSENASKEILAGDLEMSVNTTTEEVSYYGNNEIDSNVLSEGSLSNPKLLSENSHPSNDSSNSRDHLINLKLKRDAYTKTNLLTKEAVSPTKVSPPLKVTKVKSNQSKSTFKVKITSKSHTVDDSYGKKVDKSDHKRTESKTKCMSSKTNKSNSKSKSKGNSKVVPEVAVTVEAEPPVPSVKITPDMARAFNCNPSNAKCNLSSLLETPLKTIMMDLSMDTPRFLDQNFGEAGSVLKILDIPTPNFANTPSVSSWFNGKDHTPGSYSSRPTDYSGGSSYYKPDEVEDVNFKVAAMSSAKPADQLSIINEEAVDTAVENNLSTRVLRPRPANSNRSSINTPKPAASTLNNGKNKPLANLVQKHTLSDGGNSKNKPSENVVRKHIPTESDSKSSNLDSSSNYSCYIPSSSSDIDIESPIKQAKMKSPRKSHLGSKKHISSTPVSANISIHVNEKQMNKCKNKENDLAHTLHDMLEEKRLRVKTKLTLDSNIHVNEKQVITCKNKENDLAHTQHELLEEKLLRVKAKLVSDSNKVDKTKNIPNNRSVSRLISKNKSFSNIPPPTKSPVKPRRKSDLIRSVNKSLSPVKRSLPHKPSLKTPLKKNSTKRCLPRRAKLKTTKKTVVHSDLLNSKTLVECQLSAELKTENISVPNKAIVIPVNKSRRKSSTPRKLEKLLFDPDSLERQKLLHGTFIAIAEASTKKPAARVKMWGETEIINDLSESIKKTTFESDNLESQKIVHAKFLQMPNSSNKRSVVDLNKIDDNVEVVEDLSEYNIKKTMIESDRVESQKIVGGKFLKMFDNLAKISITSVDKKFGGTEIVNDLSENNITSDFDIADRDTLVSVNSRSADDEDYPSLHLSSDETESEPTPQKILSSNSIDDGSENILRINEYINNSQPENPKTVFQANLEKEGFDSESAKKIEKDLTDSFMEDDESLLGSPIVTIENFNESKGLTNNEHVDHSLNPNIKYCKNVEDNATKVIISNSNQSIVSSVDNPVQQKIDSLQNSHKIFKIDSKDPETKLSPSLLAAPEELYPSTFNSPFNNSISQDNQPIAAVEGGSMPDDSEENCSTDVSSKCTEEAYVWENYECMNSDYIYLRFDETLKQNIQINVPDHDIDNFTLNATIDEDDVKVITISKYADLFDITPNPTWKKSKFSTKSKKIFDKKQQRRQINILHFNEVDDSSCESFSPIKKVCDTKKLHDRTGVPTPLLTDNTEQELSVKMSTVACSKSICKTSSEFDKSIDPCESGAVVSSEEKNNGVFANVTFVESSQDSSNTGQIDKTCSNLLEKRKRTDDDDDLEETSSKKAKSTAIPKSILNKIGIEVFLSKLHGP